MPRFGINSVKRCSLKVLGVAVTLGLAGCISSSNPPPPPSTTVVVPSGSAVCPDGTAPPCP